MPVTASRHGRFKDIWCLHHQGVTSANTIIFKCRQDPTLKGRGIGSWRGLSGLFIANVKRPWPFLSALLTNEKDPCSWHSFWIAQTSLVIITTLVRIAWIWKGDGCARDECSLEQLTSGRLNKRVHRHEEGLLRWLMLQRKLRLYAVFWLNTNARVSAGYVDSELSEIRNHLTEIFPPLVSASPTTQINWSILCGPVMNSHGFVTTPKARP